MRFLGRPLTSAAGHATASQWCSYESGGASRGHVCLGNLPVAVTGPLALVRREGVRWGGWERHQSQTAIGLVASLAGHLASTSASAPSSRGHVATGPGPPSRGSMGRVETLSSPTGPWGSSRVHWCVFRATASQRGSHELGMVLGYPRGCVCPRCLARWAANADCLVDAPGRSSEATGDHRGRRSLPLSTAKL